MKPDTTQAMRELIEQIKASMLLETRTNEICTGQCNACDTKLVDFICMELEDWEYRLDNGETPNFHDLSKLAKTGQKIFRALDNRGLID